MISVRSVTFFDSNLYNQEFSKEKLKIALESVKHQHKDLRTVRFTLPPIELAREPDLDQLLVISHRRSDSLIDSGFRWINQPVICNDFVSQEQRDLLSDSIKKLLSIPTCGAARPIPLFCDIIVCICSANFTTLSMSSSTLIVGFFNMSAGA